MLLMRIYYGSNFIRKNNPFDLDWLLQSIVYFNINTVLKNKLKVCFTHIVNFVLYYYDLGDTYTVDIHVT